VTLFTLKCFLGILTIALLTASLSLSGRSTQGSLRQLTLKWNLLFFLAAACLISLINIQTHQQQFETSTHQLEQELRANANEQVKQRALFIQELIEHEINQSRSELRQQLSTIVNQATSTSAHLYNQYHSTLSEKELKNLIIESLSSTLYNDGRSYLFAVQLDGTELLLSPQTGRNGSNILHFQDKEGVFFVNEMIELVNTHGEGFITYHIKKPGQDDTEFKKLSYVRYFKPLDCLIGCGEYLNEHQKNTQNRLHDRLDKLSSEGSLSLFGANYDGVSLFGPLKGQSALNIQDINGTFIVKEFIELARTGGGFLSYQMPAKLTPQSYEKVSYCVPITEWNSYIGAGINLASVETHIARAHANLKQNIYQQLKQAILFVIIVALLLWYISRRFSITIEQNVTTLNQSLQKVTTSNQYLNLDTIHIDEFNAIGQAANDMLFERHKVEDTLYESEARFRTALERAPLLVALFDAQQNVTFGNTLWFKAIGQMAPATGQPLLQQLLPVEQYDRFELAFGQLIQKQKHHKKLDASFMNAASQRIDLDISLVSIPNTKDNSVSVLLMAKDITAKRASEQKLEWVAHYDHLTGIANRHSCVEQLEILRQLPQSATTLWLFMIDLNRFQHVNDAYGHDAGDSVLKEVAKRLLNFDQKPLLVARLSSDEFIVSMVLPEGIGPKEMASLLHQEIVKPHLYNGEKFLITSCIGAAPFAQSTIDQLLQQVDIAVRTCKEDKGKRNYVEYDHKLEEIFQKDQQLEEALRLALQSLDQFQLNFQPIWDLTRSTLKGFEALIRWQHPTLGSISPAVFIPFAEQRSLIIPLGKHIFELACQTLQHWIKLDPLLVNEPIRLSVNMAPQQFMTDTFIHDIHLALERYEIPASMLCIEITETSLMEDPDLAAQRVQALKQMGIVIAIDDFGTGYSSLAYLNQFDVDTIKIDRSLVETISTDHAVAKISEAIIKLAHDLDLKVTAEGIEGHDQLNHLKNLGCDYIQGFLVGKPQSATNAEALLLERQKPWSNQDIGG
jgi:diguanylate cyclase (GGDEF)-like protein/PAS domain S-box-containing protein